MVTALGSDTDAPPVDTCAEVVVRAWHGGDGLHALAEHGQQVDAGVEAEVAAVRGVCDSMAIASFGWAHESVGRTVHALGWATAGLPTPVVLDLADEAAHGGLRGPGWQPDGVHVVGEERRDDLDLAQGGWRDDSLPARGSLGRLQPRGHAWRSKYAASGEGRSQIMCIV